MSAVAVISFHEKGFFQADLYRNASGWERADWDAGHSPDAFFTMKKGDNLSAAMSRAREKWPDCDVREACEPDEHEDE